MWSRASYWYVGSFLISLICRREREEGKNDLRNIPLISCYGLHHSLQCREHLLFDLFPAPGHC